MNQKLVMRRYLRELISSSIIYAITIIGSITLLKYFEFPKFWQVVISLSPAVPVAFVILAIMRLLIDSDELQQRVQLLAVSFSAALTGFITFSYGLLENVGFPKFSTYFFLPMMIVIWGVSVRYFEKRYQ